MAPAASQGGRRRGTNDVSGGDDKYLNENGRRGSKRRREGCTDGKNDWRHGARTGESRGGGERGDHIHKCNRVNNSKYRPESSVWVAAVQRLETTPPYNEHDIWAQ